MCTSQTLDPTASVLGVIPASAPARVAAALAAAPDGDLPVLHRGPDAVYLALESAGGTRCTGVLGRHAVRVPCALRTRLDAIAPVSTARVVGGVLHLDGVPVVVGRVVDVTVPRLRPRLRLPLQLPVEAAPTPTPAPAPDVEAMVGRGDGLTPYDDDVLCGWLALHRAAGVATPEVDARVRAAAHRTTALSAALLDCAVHGEVVPEFATWVRALGTPDESVRAADLGRIGHSSGRGLLQGARLALAGLTRTTAPHHRGAA